MLPKIFLPALVFAATCMFVSCGSNENQENGKANSSTPEAGSAGPSAGSDGTDPKGIGPHQNVELTHPLDSKMIAEGQGVYDLKCASCHKLTDEKLVGPGWKKVTDRRTPEWIMNFVTNTDEMIQKDTAAQNLLEVCLVKMPNQNLTESDARSVLELMRKNDGKN
jgi:hypothetical protein